MRSPSPFALLHLFPSLVVFAGCGGASAPTAQNPPPPAADFSVSLSPNSLTVSQAANAPVTISVAGQNGFAANVQITLTGLPSGVSSNPASPFSVAAGASVMLVLGASSSAATGSFTLTAQATSGSLSHSATLALTIQASIAASLPRTTFARTDSLAVMDDPPGEPHHRRVAYDPAGKRIFAANRAMNRVEIFSAVDQSRVAQIPVPGASSADLSEDGATVWIGTATQEAVAIDTASLTLQSRTAIQPLAPIPNSVFERPEELLAMSSGKLMVRLRQSASTQSLLALWDPLSNALTNLTSAAPALFQNGLGVMARTGDHTKLIAAANDASGALAVFDSSGNLTAGPITLGSDSIPFIAANPDGSRFAAAFVAGPGGGAQLFLLDSALNQAVPPISFTALTVAFSQDGNLLYAAQPNNSTPAIAVFDGHTLQSLGQVPDPAIQGIHSEIEDSDETHLLFALANRGVAFIDAAKPTALSATPPDFAAAPVAQPSQGPLSGGTLTNISGAAFESTVQLKFGALLAASATVLSPTQIQSTSPASLVTGALNLAAYFPSGWLALAPDAFSYGPQILETLPNAAASSGGAQVQIYGYGFGSDSSQLTVKLGGIAATVQSVDSLATIAPSLALDSTYPFPLQRLTILTPSVSSGPADITVTSPAGAATASHAFQFLQSAQVFSKPALYKFILYDQKRQWLYLSATDHVDVFDLAAQQFHSTPFTAPGGPAPSAGLRGLTLTPDSSQLVVADFGAQNLYLLNPDAATGTSVFVGGVPGFLNSGPARVAATNSQTVFVALSGEGSSTSSCASCLSQLDLSMSPPVIAPAPQPQVTTLTGSPLVQSASAGSNVFLAYNSTPGPLGLWSASAPNQFAVSPAKESAIDLAASADATTFATRTSTGATEIRSAGFTLTSIPAIAELEQIPTRTFVPGFALHPSGALLYQPFLTGPAPAAPITNPAASNLHGGIDIFDTRTGRLRVRILLPEPFAALSTDTDALHGSFLVIDETGQRLFALTSSGLTILQLASVPLSIGSVSPSTISAAAGAALTIRGSGFLSGATVSINGKFASATFVDANTLTVTTPALVPGPQQLIVTNPNSDTYTLDAALTVN